MARNRNAYLCPIKMLSTLDNFILNLSRRPIKPELRKVIRGLMYIQDGVNIEEHRWVLRSNVFLNSRLLQRWHRMSMDPSI